MKKKTTALITGVICALSATAMAAPVAKDVAINKPDYESLSDRVAKLESYIEKQDAYTKELETRLIQQTKSMPGKFQAIEQPSGPKNSTQFSGYFYLREQGQTIKTKSNNQSAETSRALLDLATDTTMNDHWHLNTESTTSYNLQTGAADKKYNGNDRIFDFASLFFEAKYDNFLGQFGRIDTYTHDGGIIMHNPVNGLALTFGNKLKGTLTAGHVSNETGVNSLGINGNPSTPIGFKYHSLELTYPASKVTKLSAGYYLAQDKQLDTQRGSDSPSIYTTAFNTTLTKNLFLMGEYMKASNTTATYTHNQGWFAHLTYRKLDLHKSGSWQIYAKYADMPEMTTLGPDVTHFRNYRGIEGGFFYVPFENMSLHLRYYYGKNVESSDTTKNLIRVEARYFF